jgi:hypothetical protein
MKKLEKLDFQKLAKLYGYEAYAIKAVCQVEASNSGYDSQGRIKVQFEPKHFSNYLKQKNIEHEITYKLDKKGYEQYVIQAGEITISNGIDTNGGEFAAFEMACEIDKDSAIKATSWGLPQILGKYHALLGYKTPTEMVKAFEQSEYNQLQGMLDFIKANPSLHKALKNKDWELFAKYYNGPLYKKFAYDTRMEKAYQEITEENS